MSGLGSIGGSQGVQSWTKAFERSASQVTTAAAQLSTDSADQAGSSADLIDGLVGMNLDANAVKANVAVVRTADEMLGSLLDMTA